MVWASTACYSDGFTLPFYGFVGPKPQRGFNSMPYHLCWDFYVPVPNVTAMQ
jgi:hypothetical protein